MKENNKGFIWLINILFVVVFGLMGFIVYDKMLNVQKETDNINEIEEKVKTTEDRFNKYIINYKNTYKTNSSNKNTYILNYVISPNPESVSNDVEYYITLDKNNNLYLTSKEKETPNIAHELISKDVMQYYVIEDPLTGDKTVYYITFKGEVYKSNLANVVYKDDKSLIKFEKLNMKYIINILDYKIEQSAEVSNNLPLFVDIDGNTYLG
ncbi:MAG: hypothetical protein IJD92_04975 [Bacilli bacterium]|nr:hypothetical protein [Bacilli bacterium]